MSSPSVAISTSNASTGLHVVADYLQLIKPRIAFLVLVTVAVSIWVASWGQPDPLVFAATLIGSALVASSAGAINQWIERDSDQIMRRTASRPLPSGRLSEFHVIAFGSITLILGLSVLAVIVSWKTVFWSVFTWVTYVCLYTPLKRHSSVNTLIGAISGASPILIGWSATGMEIDLRAIAMFSILFFWQFPHFMAIAWLYRDQYAKAGMQMLTVVDSSGQRAGIQAVLYGLALIPVSFVPGIFAPPPGGGLYAAIAFILGLSQLTCALLFLALRNDSTARLLLRASLIYLPALWLLLVLTPLL